MESECEQYCCSWRTFRTTHLERIDTTDKFTWGWEYKSCFYTIFLEQQCRRGKLGETCIASSRGTGCMVKRDSYQRKFVLQ